MGADGGVCWLEVLDREEFIRLTNPFNFAHFNDYHWSNNEWVNDHAIEGYLYATYGTDQEISLDYIVEILDTLEYLGQNPLEAHSIGIANLPDWNFVEMFWEWKTVPGRFRPSWWGLGDLCNSINWEMTPLGMGFVPEPGSVLAMTLGEWASEVQKTFVKGSYGRVETWT